MVVDVRVPAGQRHLHAADADLDQPPRGQAAAAERRVAVRLPHRQRLLRHVEHLRLAEHALVREPVAGGLVAARGDLARELRVPANGHAEEEEGRGRAELVEQVEHGRRLPLERGPAGVPVGRAGRPVDELVPVLEVDAEEQRRLLRRHGRECTAQAPESAVTDWPLPASLAR